MKTLFNICRPSTWLPLSVTGLLSVIYALRNRFSQVLLLYVEGCEKKSQFPTNISICLRNDTRHGHSYNRRQIETYTRRILNGVNLNDLERL